MSTYIKHSCDLCQSSNALEVPFSRLYQNNQPTHICKNCGFVYVKNRRSAEEIAKTWSEELYRENKNSYKPYTSNIPAVKARLTYVADFIHKKIGLHGKKVVDIGAGEGLFINIAWSQYQAEVLGIEPSSENCKMIKSQGMDCFVGTIEEYIANGRKEIADIVTISWTLEACSSSRDMLDAAWKILKPDGHIAVATGSRILVPFKKPLGDFLSFNPTDTHPVRFSANTLEGLLSECSFKKKCVNRFLDTDYLCMIARKVPRDLKLNWKKDNWLKVYDFFERWHKESMYYM